MGGKGSTSASGARPVDRTCARPLWSQILDDLRRRLADGEFVDGFPGEHVLVAEYDVSRHTVREALRVLRTEGLVSADRGRQPHLIQVAADVVAMGAVCRFSELLELAGHRLRGVVCVREIRRDPTVAALLGLEHDAKLIHLERLRLVGDEPVAVDRSWLPERFGAPLLDADCAEITGSDLYLRLCGVRATSGRERIAAVAPTEAERRLLGMESREVACAVERVSFAGMTAVEFRRTTLHSRWFGVTATFSVSDGYRMDLSAGA